MCRDATQGDRGVQERHVGRSDIPTGSSVRVDKEMGEEVVVQL